jgi:large subunit ribosomal protein L23
MTNKFLIKHPIITEKATDLSHQGKYIFLVNQKATAPEVKKAIEAIYKVNIIRVHMINTKAKPRKWGRKISVKSGYRKAIVTLKEGQKLDILPH